MRQVLGLISTRRNEIFNLTSFLPLITALNSATPHWMSSDLSGMWEVITLRPSTTTKWRCYQQYLLLSYGYKKNNNINWLHKPIIIEPICGLWIRSVMLFNTILHTLELHTLDDNCIFCYLNGVYRILGGFYFYSPYYLS